MTVGKSQAALRPTALGTLLQSSAYGSVIPVGYGMTQSVLLANWAANLRQGGSIKKFKQLKKGITAYVENIDFILGHNPIRGVNQVWVNGGLYPLTYTSETVSVNLTPSVTISDPKFYALVAVTSVENYSVTFNDYGGSGSQTLTGSYEVPLWNELETGPDPTDPSGTRNYPYSYRWKPSYGAVVYLDTQSPAFTVSTLKFYYAALMAATSYQPPITKLRLTFEDQLGSGPEYASSGVPSQQIIYPHFAGLGSENIDLGAAGALPQILPEVNFKWGIYPTGDADFVDIIEDICKSGLAQAALSASPAYTQMERGCSGYNLPGCIQKKFLASVEAFTATDVTYNLQVTAGNFMVVVSTGGSSGSLTIADTLGSTWTPVFTTGTYFQAWYARVGASGANTVTVSGRGYDWNLILLEVAGVDTFDSFSVGSAAAASIATTNVAKYPGYLLAIGVGSPANDPKLQQWTTVLSGATSGDGAILLLERTVNSPGTYGVNVSGFAGQDGIAILAFKCVNPPSYPKPVGRFVDVPSLNLTRQQCRAYGLWGSLTMTSQQAAADWIKQLAQAANAAPVYMGSKLYFLPYAEASAVGNGAVYTSPTAAGPLYNLSTENGDFTRPPQCKTASRNNLPNVLQMQCIAREANYNQVVVQQPIAAAIALYGERKADPVINNAVQDASIARTLLGIQGRVNQYGGDSWGFTLNAKWSLLAPLALITITDPLQGIAAVPVRLTSVAEQQDGSLECQAEPFVYGMRSPTALTADTPQPYQGDPNQQVGLGVNPPLIFEATQRLAQQSAPAQIWMAISCSDPNYGGCQPYISTDGGVSYTPATDAPVVGSAAMGYTTADWPAAADPDTANNLAVLLTSGTLESYAAQQRDAFQYPCYVGWPSIGTVEATFTSGNPSEVTALGALFTNPTTPALPSDATIVNIFPVIIVSTTPADATATTQAYCGTGMTATSGGTSFLSATGAVTPPEEQYLAAGIGTSLAGQEIRYSLGLSASGGAATDGTVIGVGWAIYYSSATPSQDTTLPPPFNSPPPAGFGWAWAFPQTVATGEVGSGSNASITAGGVAPPAGIPYELMAYNSATLTAPEAYTLNATGAGNELRRGVYGAPSAGMGMDHPPHSPFAFLAPSGGGIARINMDPAWIGVKLYFKFPTYNSFGGSLQPLSDCAAYTYTPTGVAGNAGPSNGFLINGS